MKKTLMACVALLSFTAFTILNNNKKAFKKLRALEGTWKMPLKKGVLCEEWKIVDKNYLQSKGYMLKGTDTIINERVALTKTGKGIFYTSTVENQNNKQPIAFTMTKSDNNIFVFENPNHDFPKRIVYQLVTADSLHAWVDDGTEGSKKKQHFYYKKQ